MNNESGKKAYSLNCSMDNLNYKINILVYTSIPKTII